MDGSALPSARVLNVELFLNREKYHVDENNKLLMPFAQLIAHDITGLPNDVPRNETSELTYITQTIYRSTLIPSRH